VEHLCDVEESGVTAIPITLDGVDVLVDERAQGARRNGG